MKKTLLILASTIAISPTAQAKWKSSIYVDEMEGFTRTIYLLDSSNAKFVHRNQTNKEHDDLYLITGDSYICASGDYLNIKIKIDNQPVETVNVTLSTGKDALFFDTTKQVKNPNSTYTSEGYIEAWSKDYRKDRSIGDGENVKAYYATHGTLEDKYKEVDNGLIDKIKSAKKIFVRIHDTCGTHTDLKFVSK